MRRFNKEGTPTQKITTAATVIALATLACSTTIPTEPVAQEYIYPCQQNLLPEDVETIMPQTFLVAKPTSGNYCDFILQQRPDIVILDIDTTAVQLLIRHHLYPDQNFYSGSWSSFPLPTNPYNISWIYFSTQIEDLDSHFQITTEENDFPAPFPTQTLPGLPIANR